MGQQDRKNPVLLNYFQGEGRNRRDKGKEYKRMVQTYTGDYVWGHQYKLMNKQV